MLFLDVVQFPTNYYNELFKFVKVFLEFDVTINILKIGIYNLI